ncbi:MAG: ATPase [Pseudomonadota bacterium]
MIDINGSLLIQIANFLVLLVVLNYLLYRPIRTILLKRKEKFEGYEADISRLTAQVRDSLKDIDDRLAEYRREGFTKKDDLKGRGLEEEKKILAAAAQKAEVEIQKVKEQVKTEIGTARAALKTELDLFSVQLAQKVLGRSLS